MSHPEVEVQFVAPGPRPVRGILVRPDGAPSAALAITHGRSNNMRHPLLKRLSLAAADSGLASLRINFRYIDEKANASRDLSREEQELRAAVEFLQVQVPGVPVFVAASRWALGSARGPPTIRPSRG